MYDTHDWVELTLPQYAAGAVEGLPKRLEYLPEEIDVTDLEHFISTMCEYYRQVYEFVTKAYQEQKVQVDGEFEKYKAMCGGNETQSCVNAEITTLRTLRNPVEVERDIRRKAQLVKEGDCIDLEGYRNVKAWYVYRDSLGRLSVSRTLDDYGRTLPRQAWPMYLKHGKELFEQFQNANIIQMDSFPALYIDDVPIEEHPKYDRYIYHYQDMRFFPEGMDCECEQAQNVTITHSMYPEEEFCVRGELMW